MQNTQFTDTNSKYYNPIAKIRSLIKNLDSELINLSGHQKTKRSSANRNGKYYKATISNPVRMLAVSTYDPSSVQTRTLSGMYRTKVIDAYRNRRIFTVYGNYHTIRRSLLRRGWIEKLPPGRYPKLQNLTEDVLLYHAQRGNDYEAVIISKIINHFPAFFIWQPKHFRDLNSDVLPYRNRVRRTRGLDFSTKVGLIGCAEHELWYRQEGVSGMSYPRFFRLGGTSEERVAFIDEFRQTQCRCLLKHMVERVKDPAQVANEEFGTIPPTILNFAIECAKKQLNDFDAIDEEEPEDSESKIAEWQNFLTNSSLILHKKAKFKTSAQDIIEYTKVARSLIEQLHVKRPDYKWDGIRNLWILKPGYQCRGIGIIIRNSIDDILQWANNNPNRRYIAQKYIERPLLIYKTKFDIRQYMLLTIGETTVSIWLYRDCYLRFSSQEFSIDDLRESIHLTNNSVQKKYKNKQSRDIRLPKHNMWSLEQFKLYLKSQNVTEDVWNQRVYAGFKQNLIALINTSMEETDFAQNAFELYGCDFMLDEQYHPILIEINSTPDLSPSTEVTARICPMVLKDLLKVVVDLPQNSRTMTGLFDKVYEVNYKTKMIVDKEHGLDIDGLPMTLHEPLRPSNKRGGLFRKPKFLKKSETAKATAKKLKTEPSADAQIIANIQEMADGKGLKAFAKEALALRYTRPK